MKKRAWLRIALLFALFEGAVYGAVEWAERANLSRYWGLSRGDAPEFVTVAVPDGAPVELAVESLVGTYGSLYGDLTLAADHSATWTKSGMWYLMEYGCTYGIEIENLAERGRWSLDEGVVDVELAEERLILQPIARSYRPALQSENPRVGVLERLTP